MLNITKEREKRGWTKAELSRRSGVNLPAICNLEHGRLIPWPKVKRDLAEALEVENPDSLFEIVEVRADGETAES